ncbi:MAG: glycosyltransferase [Flavobacteriales bacterium]
MWTPLVASGPIDVIIPLYNGGRFISDALRSVLEQTLPPRSVIVVDDGSTDDGAYVVERFIAANTSGTRITCVRQSNAGPNAARNAGIAHSTAPLLAFLDADDLWHPTKLEKQVALFDRAPASLGLVYCDFDTMDDGGAPLDTGRNAHTEPPLRGRVFDRLLFANRISGSASAVLIRRTCFDAAGLFDTELRGSEDWDMWLRISERWEVDLVDESLVSIRRHGASAQMDTDHMLRNMLLFFAKWFPYAKGWKDVCRYWGHLIAEFALRSKDPEAARRLAGSILSPPMERAFFARTLGSLAVYMRLKQLRARMNKHVDRR